MANYEERRDNRHFEVTKAVLKQIHEQDQELSIDKRYPTAYGILTGYFKALLVNFAEHFSPEQIGEIRIVLDQLSRLTREDENLDEATKSKQDQLAQALRETEDTHTS